MSHFLRRFLAGTLGLAVLLGAALGASPSLTQYLQAMGYVAVPFDNTDASGFFHLDATVNGRSVRFFIDTGAPVTIIDSDKVEGIKTLGELGKKVRDGDGRLIDNPNLLLIDELKLGPITFAHQTALKHELDVDSIPIGFSGLLGLDFLYRNCCLIDCGDQKLYLRPRPLSPAQLLSLKQSLAGSGFKTVALEKGSRLRVDSKINGQPLTWLIDTGARYTIIDRVGERMMGLHPIMEVRVGSNIPQPKEVQMRGLNGIGLGRQTAHVMKLHQFEIGQQSWRDFFMLGADIDVAGKWPATEGNPPHGILGAELLTNDGAIIDPRDGTLWFRRADPERY
jgi:hypothetical protein